MIRKMTVNDLEEVLEIERSCFNDPWTKDNFEYEIKENLFSRSYVYEEEGKILGYGMMWILFESADITNIAVREDSRNKGIGSALLSHMEEEAKREGVEFLHLEVRLSNTKAISLYEKSGFEVLRLRKGYYSDNFEDAYEMMKGVAPYEEDPGDREQL